VVRKGVEILRIEADLAAEAEIEDLARVGLPIVDDLQGFRSMLAPSYLFKFLPATTGDGFEHAPRLVRQPTLFRPRAGLRSGPGKIELGTATADPLGEVPVRDIVTLVYGVFDSVMLPGRVLATVRNPMRFAPHAFFKTDTLAVVDPGTRPSLSFRQRRDLRKRVAEY
jgi:hypothetical protein